MSTFTYTARSRAGQETQGTRQAGSKSDLARALRQEGYILTSAIFLDKRSKNSQITLPAQAGLRFLTTLFKRVSLVEKIMFARHLSVMLNAGLSVNRGLQILSKQTKSQYFAKVLSAMEKDIRAGQPFSKALSKYPRVFSDLFVNMAKVGETGGKLEEVLKLLAIQMKKDHDLRSRVKGAMVYPGVIVAAMVGIGILMMVMVVPKLTAVFEELKIELPNSTKFIIGFSKALQHNLFLIIGTLIILIILVRIMPRIKKAKELFDWLVLRLPIFSGISRKINTARLARTLGSMIEGGIPIVKSLKITSQTLSNSFFKKSLYFCAEQVQKGDQLSSMLTKFTNLYPPMVTQMIQVGEETGTLTDILKRLAEFYEEEVNLLTKSLSSIIEPILMIIIGAAVGFFAISMIQPMYSMMGGM